jgi:large subunit ribosomal protein L24
MKKNSITKNSKVKIITGDQKGKTGKVTSINRKANTLKIEGLNLQVKHYKARRNNEKSERKVIEGSIHISNVVLCDEM